MPLTEKQSLLKKLAETVVLQEKITRIDYINQMHAIIQDLTQDQLIQVVNTINMAPALKFLMSAGVYDEARRLVVAKLAALERTTA